MKAVIDDNITSSSSNIRRIAFDTATELMSLSNVDVLLEGILYNKIKAKLLPDQQLFFEKIYRIDNSAKDLTDYDIIKAIKWIAKSESNSRKVLILSENTLDYKSVCNETYIRCVTPSQFLGSVEQAQKLYSAKIFSTLEDSLMAVLFILSN